MNDRRKHELLETLVAGLCDERGTGMPNARDAHELWTAFRALVNTRPPIPASDAWLRMQDELLQGLIAERGITSVASLGAVDAGVACVDGQAVDAGVPSTSGRAVIPSVSSGPKGPATRTRPRVCLWRGDITTLAADAIVNAANSQMLGCWVPGHYCVDNAIHTFAGVQLRLACAELMEAQGHDEGTGLAKVTPAYNLPATYVIHTVGPVAQGRPTARHRLQLAACYESCLDAAADKGCTSIAFCCISTGVFGFPQADAADIAVRTVRGWLDAHGSVMTVVFNVFTDTDERVYRQLLAARHDDA